MKERIFHARLDLDASANIRRLQAYIRSISPGFKRPPKLLARANERANLRRVKLHGRQTDYVRSMGSRYLW